MGVSQKQIIEQVYNKLGLSARSYHRTLKVARTIADLDNKADINDKHLIEALSYRNVEKKYWV